MLASLAVNKSGPPSDIRALISRSPHRDAPQRGASGFVRIVTNPKIWEEPTTIEDALRLIERLRTRSNARLLTHGSTSWDIFARICVSARARGKLVADAYHAALAIEYGRELVTVDSDFARFHGLRWRHPLAGSP